MTNHEPPVTLEDADFDAMYRGEPFVAGMDMRFERVPWDIGEPQPVVVDLEAAGGVTGTVLDVGCGAGENALFLAERGYQVVGVDGSAAGLARARERARERGLDIEFVQDDATSLGKLAQRFDTVLDSALYHCLPEQKRADYAAALHRVTNPGAVLHLFCFATAEVDAPPMAISRQNLHANLGSHWDIISIEQAAYVTTATPEEYARLSSLLETTELATAMNATHVSTDGRGRAELPVWHLHAQRR